MPTGGRSPTASWPNGAESAPAQDADAGSCTARTPSRTPGRSTATVQCTVTFSALTHLQCSRDGSRHDADVVQGTSPLGAPLLARYDLERVAATVPREDVAGRAPTLWRYAELLPVRDRQHVVSLGEGMTPLLDLPTAGAPTGVATRRGRAQGGVRTGG